METFDVRNRWDHYSDDSLLSKRDQELELLQQNSQSFPLSSISVPLRYEGDYRNSSMFFESETGSNCSDDVFNSLSEQMSQGHRQITPEQSPSKRANLQSGYDSQPQAVIGTAASLLQPQAIISEPAARNNVNMVSLAPNPGPSGSGQHSATLASDIQRSSRKSAEKNRRDKMNVCYASIPKLIPMLETATKRLDKISLLRLAAADLRLYQMSVNSSSEDNSSGGGGPIRRKRRWRPSCMGSDHLSSLLDVADGFVLVCNLDGKILYVSAAVDRYLGHQNIDLMGHMIFTFLHKADVQSVREEIDSMMSSGSNFRVDGDEVISKRISFFCRIREKTQPRAEVITYQVIHVEGQLSGPAPADPKVGPLSHLQLDHSQFKLYAFIRIVKTSPCKRLTLTDAVQNEYITRHKLDGTIIFADHRISTLTGHLPKEVTGVSAHKYMDQNDLVIALFAQKQMFASETGKGTVVYRLRTKSNKFIYLRSAGQLEYDQSTLQADHFVCVNTLLSDDDGERERLLLWDRFSPHINSSAVENLTHYITAVHANALKRIHNTKEAVAINSNRHVPGGHAPNPLALENIVEPNLYLGSNCLVKLKESVDEHEDDYEHRRSYDRSYNSDKSDYGSSPAGRQPCSPEMMNPPTPSTSPLNIETSDLSQIMQGKMSSQFIVNRSAPPYQWNYPHGNSPVVANHRNSSEGYSAQMSSPSSMTSSPLLDELHHLHPHSANM